jgi:quercetin 2,3-dioxygenase
MKWRKSNERGFFENNWLKSFHTFSFSDYHDSNWMHFSDLRVINHDWVKAKMGFGTHPHQNMEIISYVLNGTVEHRDSMGNKKQILAGEIQVMSAGTGVLHSEYNPDDKKDFELIQIWVIPRRNGGAPAYGQKSFSREDRLNKLLTIVTPDIDSENSVLQKNSSVETLQIRQDATIAAAIVEDQKSLVVELSNKKSYWLQVANGELIAEVNTPEGKVEQKLDKGSGLGLNAGDASSIRLSAKGGESEFLFFELREKIS